MHCNLTPASREHRSCRQTMHGTLVYELSIFDLIMVPWVPKCPLLVDSVGRLTNRHIDRFYRFCSRGQQIQRYTSDAALSYSGPQLRCGQIYITLIKWRYCKSLQHGDGATTLNDVRKWSWEHKSFQSPTRLTCTETELKSHYPVDGSRWSNDCVERPGHRRCRQFDGWNQQAIDTCVQGGIITTTGYYRPLQLREPVVGADPRVNEILYMSTVALRCTLSDGNVKVTQHHFVARHFIEIW